MSRGLSLVALLVLAGGCALGPSWPPLTCPGRGGPPWTELASPRLLLRTDLPPKQARALFDELEQAYGALEQVFHRDLPMVPPPTDRVRVTAFAHQEDVAALHPLAGGFFSAGHAWEPAPNIVLFNARDWHGHGILRHELTHRFVAHYLPTAPQWLNEGLADTYSTVRVHDGKVEVGAWDPDLYRYGYQPDVRELFVADEAQFLERPGYYNEAHALVHLLQSERRSHRPQFESLLRHLAEGMPAELAWSESFHVVNLDALENEVNGYRFIVLRTDTRWFHAGPTPAVEPRVRALSDAEVHVLWVELRSWRRRSEREQAESDLQQARRSAPDSAELHYWTGCFLRATGGSPRRVADELRAALARAPEDPAYLLPVSQLEPSSALTARLAKQAITAAQWSAVAEQERQLGLNEDALVAARRAVAVEAACSECWSVLAQLAFDAQRLDEASVAMQRAAWLVPARSDYQELAQRYLRAAREAKAAPPP
jgi:hypothetical protein